MEALLFVCFVVLLISISQFLRYKLEVKEPIKPLQSDKDYDDYYCELAYAAENIKDHKSCQSILMAIGFFEKAYKPIHGMTTINDVNNLISIAERRYKKVSQSQAAMATGMWL